MGYDTIQEQYTLKWNDSIQFDSEGFRFDSIRFILARLSSRGYDAMDFLLKADHHFIK